MKRISALATMVAIGLISIAALGAGSASADVLCKDIALNYNCSPENTYGVGSEFHGSSYGIVTLNTGQGPNIFTCAESKLDMTVTDAGGPVTGEIPEVDVANLTFESCGDDPTSVVSDGSAYIYRYDSSQKGRFLWEGEQIETNTNLIVGSGTKCTYSIEDPGTLAGWKTVETSNPTQIVFNNTMSQRVGGPIWCPAKAYFSAKYDIDLPQGELYPQGIYVVPQ